MPSEPAGKIALAVVESRRNVALIRVWASDRTLDDLREDVKTRYAIERAFIALDAAIRDIPKSHLDAHGIPAKLIAGFRNLLAHTYDDVVDERLMLTISDDLPALDASLERLLAVLSAGS